MFDTRLYEAHIPLPLPTSQRIATPSNPPLLSLAPLRNPSIITILSPFFLSLSFSLSLSPSFSDRKNLTPFSLPPWLRKPRTKKPSSRFPKPLLYASTTAGSQGTLPPTTCARTASPPSQLPPPQRHQLPRPPPESPRPPLDPLRPRVLRRDPSPKSLPWQQILPPPTKTRRPKPNASSIAAPVAGGRSDSPDSGAGVANSSARSIGTPIATTAVTTTKPPVEKPSPGRIRWLEPRRSSKSEEQKNKKGRETRNGISSLTRLRAIGSSHGSSLLFFSDYIYREAKESS